MFSITASLLWRTVYDLAGKIFGECNMIHCNNMNNKNNKSYKNASTKKFLRRGELK